MNNDTLVQSRIDRITTQWSVVKDTSHFALRYAPAIRNYIASLASNPSDIEDILQNFLFRVVKNGFHRERIDEGKFRYYLKSAVRNAVRSHYRRKQVDLDQGDLFRDLASPESDGEDPWTAEWRECLLDRTWQALERYESDSAPHLSYSILKLAVDHPAESSPQLAARASELAGRQISDAAYRQQLHRTRKRFAEFLVDEVAATIERPGSGDIESELVDLGLIGYVRGFLNFE